ncbi:hypothetical protein [Nocardioides daphniae]|uniref:Uncharacterized protein n=1 Tax=Nocardioides daphniae TaxID=402297 RepID=A0A4P7U8H5_9ACTN|nr:hypothetical protein [Nocardioides daphniae]QCC76390.1 hypothetical protein E2C04_02695 [Nocardioides daphniae]
MLQRRDGATWRAVGRVKLGAKKKVTFASAVPTSAKGSVRYRVRAVLGKKTYEAGALTLKVVSAPRSSSPRARAAATPTSPRRTRAPSRRCVPGASSRSSATSTAPGRRSRRPRPRGPARP